MGYAFRKGILVFIGILNVNDRFGYFRLILFNFCLFFIFDVILQLNIGTGALCLMHLGKEFLCSLDYRKASHAIRC